MHRHHIVYRSQGGLDFPLNFKYYPGYEEHEGRNGPHLNKAVDLELKCNLQKELSLLFSDKDYFTLNEIAGRIGVTERYLTPYFRKVQSAAGLYHKEHIIRRLMGGKKYEVEG